MTDSLTVAERRVLDAMAAVPRATLERTLRNTLHDEEHGRAAARAELARRDAVVEERPGAPPRLERAHLPPSVAELVAVENVLRAQRPPSGSTEPVVVDLTLAELGVVHAALGVATVAAAEPDAAAAARVGWVELLAALVQKSGGEPLSPDARARLCRVDLVSLERMATALAGAESVETAPHCAACGGVLARYSDPDGGRGYTCVKCD